MVGITATSIPGWRRHTPTYVFEFEGGLVQLARFYFDIERALEAAGMAD
jgi:hypothetical protein